MSNSNNGAAIALLIGGAIVVVTYATLRIMAARKRRPREADLSEVVVPKTTDGMFGIKPEYVAALTASNRLPRLEKGSLILGKYLVPVSATDTQYLYHVEASLINDTAGMYQIITVTKGVNSAPANTV